VFSARSVPRSYKRTQLGDASKQRSRVEFRDASLPRYELGIELSWQLQNNGKKGIRM
jgi:hypothetical protein